MEIEQPSVSKHLKVLKEVGLVEARREGRQMLYKVNAMAIRPLHEWASTFERPVETSAAANQGTGRGQQCTEKIVLWNFKRGGNREFTRTIAGSGNDHIAEVDCSARVDRADVCRVAGPAWTVTTRLKWTGQCR